MKKIFKILGLICILFILAIIAIPFVFKGTLQNKVRYIVNEHVNADVDFSNLDISLIRSFPNASVAIDKFIIINQAPFKGDTLAYSKRIELDMSVKELFNNSSKPIKVQKIKIDNAYLAIITDSLGQSNLDIAKNKSTSSDTNDKSEPFTFSLDHYEINNSKIIYRDDVSKMALNLSDLNHSGDGSVSGDKILLDTHSQSEASYLLDGTKYLDKNKLQLDAQLELDLENQRYSFKENKALVNQLPLEFTGFVQLFEKHTDIDLSFKTPSSDFKNFLAIIPEEYAKNINQVKTTGDFIINGIIKGKSDDTFIPKMDITISSNNASFKYPDLPKAVRDININTQIKNTTGLVDDTYVDINKLSFKIDQDVFDAKVKLKNLTKNMVVDLILKGTLNLANLNQAYPLQLDQKLNGLVNADITSHFDMLSVEKEQYENVKSAGSATIKGFTYASEETPNEIKIEEAAVSFNPKTITLNNLKATTGRSDLDAKGTIDNLMGFLFAKQDLKGNFDVSSDIFAVDDFMTAEETSVNGQTTEDETMRIPSFLDATLNFNSKKVFYDNLVLNNTKGAVKIKDQTAFFQNVTSGIFDGGIALNGNVTTKSKTPTFDMALDLNKIDIVKSFKDLDLLKGLAPIASALTGNLSSKINLKGNLDEGLLPVLTSLKGKANTEIQNAEVSTTTTPFLANIDSKLNFLDIDQLSLKDIKTNLSFEDGKINVKPFRFDVKGVKVTAGGEHGFDQYIDYNVILDVPAKYLTKEASHLLSQLSDKEASEMSVGIPIGVSGGYNSPSVKIDTKGAVKQLSQQIIAKQKEKAKEQLIGKGQEVLSGILGNKNTTDSKTETESKTPKENIKDAANSILGGLLGKKKEKKERK